MPLESVHLVKIRLGSIRHLREIN